MALGTSVCVTVMEFSAPVYRSSDIDKVKQIISELEKKILITTAAVSPCEATHPNWKSETIYLRIVSLPA